MRRELGSRGGDSQMGLGEGKENIRGDWAAPDRQATRAMGGAARGWHCRTRPVRGGEATRAVDRAGCERKQTRDRLQKRQAEFSLALLPQRRGVRRNMQGNRLSRSARGPLPRSSQKQTAETDCPLPESSPAETDCPLSEWPSPSGMAGRDGHSHPDPRRGPSGVNGLRACPSSR